MSADATINASTATGILHVTVTILVERGRVAASVGADAWARALTSSRPSGAIERSVAPFFADIADVQQHIFAHEAVLDGAVRELALLLPRAVTWETEGREMVATLADTPRRRAVVGRSSWYIHSSGALSYNLAFSLEYRHDIREYFALSLLQKVLFAGDDPERTREASAREEPGAFQAAIGDGAPKSLWAVIRAIFEEDAARLLRELIGVDAGGGLWLRLAQDPARRDAPAPAFHRAAFVFHDPRFFAALAAIDRDPDRRPRAASDLAALPDESEPGTRLTYDAATLDRVDAWEPGRLDLYFLAGFLRGILDFLRQSASEVKDGTEQQVARGDDPHFLFYVHRHSIVEVVAASRSLECGRQSLGTCPYLFLVHIMAVEDEALIGLYERRVQAIVDRIESATRGASAAAGVDPRVAGDLVNHFHGERLALFTEVEKHTHRNVFRYETERGFYDAVQRTRGLGERLAHWERLLAQLSATIDGLRSVAQQRADRTLNAIVVWITACSIFQVLFAATAALRVLGLDEAAAAMDRGFLALLAVLLPTLVALGLRALLRRRPLKRA